MKTRSLFWKFFFTVLAVGLLLSLITPKIPAVYANEVTTDSSASTRTVCTKDIDELAAKQKGALKEGIYVIQSALNGRFVLDVAAGSKENGANVQLYESNVTPAQKWRVSEDEDGYITITNIASGKVLDVSGGSDCSGANVWQYEKNGSRAQKWVAVSTDSGYVLQSALGNSLVLDVSNGLSTNQANVQVFSDNGTLAQRFLFRSLDVKVEPSERLLDDGTYLLFSGSLSLDVKNGLINDGTRLQGFTPNGTLAQSFYLHYDRQVGFYTIASANSGRLLDADKGDLVPGASVALYGTSAEGALQRYWALRAQDDGSFIVINAANGCALSIVGESSGSPVATVSKDDKDLDSWTISEASFAWGADELDQKAASGSEVISDGDYLIGASIGYRKVLDVAGGSQQNFANVQLYTANSTDAQSWSIENLDDGYVRIVNIRSGKVLDVALGLTVPGSNVQLYEWNGTRAQKWLPERTDAGVVFFSALGHGLVLDVSGAGQTDGTNVDVYIANDTVAQAFNLYALSPVVEPCDNLGFEGWYRIESSIDSAFVIDVNGGAASNGTNISLHRSNGTLAQLFRLVWDNGWYRVQTAFGGLLDLDGGNPMPGSNVQQWFNDSPSDNQLWALIDNHDGTYSLQNKASGLYLDVASGIVSNGSNIQGYTPNGTSSQRFVLSRCTELLPEGVMTLISGLSGSLVLDVSAGSVSEGATIQVYSSNSSPAQKWYIARIDGRENTYSIQSLASALYLSVSSGDKVTQLADVSSENAWWEPDIIGGAYILKNAATGKVLDVQNGVSRPGTPVQLFESNGSLAQRFRISQTDVLSSGTYVIHSALSYEKVIDVSNGSLSSGANIQLFDSNDTGAQKWNITRNADGTYSIINCASECSLDVYNGNAYSGANIQQYASNNSSAQRWYIVWEPASGGYVFHSALNRSYVIDVDGGNAANGSNVQVYEANKSKAQGFLLSQTTYVPTAQVRMNRMAQGYSSSTNYLIMVDTTSNYLGIFTGGRGNWTLKDYWICSTGAPNTPTVIGQYTVGAKGYSFGHGYTCYYYTQFYGDYLIHSVKYYQGTFNVLDGRMGVNISEGCVRLPIERAKWIWDNIPTGTKVVTYR